MSLSIWCLIVLWMQFILGQWISCCARHLVHLAGYRLPATSWEAAGTVAREFIQPVLKEQVPVGTLLALRGATACAAAQKSGVPWIVEQSQLRAGEPGFFGLDDWTDNLRMSGGTVIFHLSPIASTCRSPAKSYGWQFCPSAVAFCAPSRGGLERQLQLLRNRCGNVLVGGKMC